MTYRHTPAMGEISGFGGGYEECCQDMLEAGVQWLVANSGRDIRAREMKAEFEGQLIEFYGLLDVDGEDGKALEKVMLDAAKGEATGAMHQAVFSRLMYIAKNGWDEYVKALEEGGKR